MPMIAMTIARMIAATPALMVGLPVASTAINGPLNGGVPTALQSRGFHGWRTAASSCSFGSICGGGFHETIDRRRARHRSVRAELGGAGARSGQLQRPDPRRHDL